MLAGIGFRVVWTKPGGLDEIRGRIAERLYVDGPARQRRHGDHRVRPGMEMKTMKYPIAPNGIFKTIQGEGALLGTPMVFVRLAGCSIGCAACDTDYRVSERLTANEIRQQVERLTPKGQLWTWITGGEPTDHNLWPLFEELRLIGLIAVATSGHGSFRGVVPMADFLSVSPHSGKPDQLAITMGSQINLVPGLNGLSLADWEGFNPKNFKYGGYVTPFWYTPGERMERVAECVAFVERNPGFKLGIQAHKFWGLA